MWCKTINETKNCWWLIINLRQMITYNFSYFFSKSSLSRNNSWHKHYLDVVFLKNLYPNDTELPNWCSHSTHMVSSQASFLLAFILNNVMDINILSLINIFESLTPMLNMMQPHKHQNQHWTSQHQVFRNHIFINETKRMHHPTSILHYALQHHASEIGVGITI